MLRKDDNERVKKCTNYDSEGIKQSTSKKTWKIDQGVIK